MTFILKNCFLISESHHVLQNPVKNFEKKSGVKILTSLCSGDWELFKSEASCIQLELCIYLKHQTLHFLLKGFIIFPRRVICVNCASGEVRVLKIRMMACETQVGLLQVDFPQKPSSPQRSPACPATGLSPRPLVSPVPDCWPLGPTVPALAPRPLAFPRGRGSRQAWSQDQPVVPAQVACMCWTLPLGAFVAQQRNHRFFFLSMK